MSLALDIVTPEKTLFSGTVYMAVVSGAEGEFGVLDRHAPLVSNLRPGVVRILDEQNKIQKRVLVTEGYVEVTPERCTILATEAYDFDSVERDELEKRLVAIKRIHDQAHDEEQKILAQKDVDIAQDVVDAFLRECDTIGRK